MKTYPLYIVLFFSFLVFFSCKKSELITYEGKPMLYFSKTSVDSVSINFSFGSQSIKDTIVKIPVGLIGLPLSSAAAYDITINDQLTTAIRGSEFEWPSQFNFPAQKSTDTVLLKLNRTERLTKGTYVIALELKANAQFSNALLNNNVAKNKSSKMRLFITDLLLPTAKWVSTPGVNGSDYFLGPFSKKKIEVLVFLDNDWPFLTLYLNVDANASYYGNLLNIYLKAQKAAGTPVLEDDGTEMKVGPNYK